MDYRVSVCVFPPNETCDLSSCSGKPKLVQKAEYRLHGNIQSMASVLFPGSDKDTLLLAFNDAKVSHYIHS